MDILYKVWIPIRDLYSMREPRRTIHQEYEVRGASTVLCRTRLTWKRQLQSWTIGLKSNRGQNSALNCQEAAITVMTDKVKRKYKTLNRQRFVKMVKGVQPSLRAK